MKPIPSPFREGSVAESKMRNSIRSFRRCEEPVSGAAVFGSSFAVHPVGEPECDLLVAGRIGTCAMASSYKQGEVSGFGMAEAVQPGPRRSFRSLGSFIGLLCESTVDPGVTRSTTSRSEALHRQARPRQCHRQRRTSSIRHARRRTVGSRLQSAVPGYWLSHDRTPGDHRNKALQPTKLLIALPRHRVLAAAFSAIPSSP